MSLYRMVAVIALLVLISGCTSLSSVKPWEKGVLSRPEMTFEKDPQDAAFSEHIYFSREAASGGNGVGGGGCGCN